MDGRRLVSSFRDTVYFLLLFSTPCYLYGENQENFFWNQIYGQITRSHTTPCYSVIIPVSFSLKSNSTHIARGSSVQILRTMAQLAPLEDCEYSDCNNSDSESISNCSWIKRWVCQWYLVDCRSIASFSLIPSSNHLTMGFLFVLLCYSLPQQNDSPKRSPTGAKTTEGGRSIDSNNQWWSGHSRPSILQQTIDSLNKTTTSSCGKEDYY